ncbi:zinc-binding alcohol dehydrogenase family protein [Lactiplantibacillus paraplantarum]|uniref:zinc-binding alcohol dehydrogenase family protein n=1 Tax=Lactiplantibacillus paraplantarum TaxID=60520 RepID=UPI0020738BC8|nr:zinc-binding alcohol dehydrogenase family protein [Lactiplantibacillus paraplantarum]
MHAIGFTDHLPIENPASLQDVTITKPTPHGHDILVQIQAVAVNPVDVGVRKAGHEHLTRPKILGWDATGIVTAVGKAVTLFQPGDWVFYAGSFNRPGCDSAYHLVDERLVGHAPKTLTPAACAAMPLTSLTAYEALFEQLHISFDPAKPNFQKRNQTVLIINGTGGVGSIATQLAKLAGLTVISSASRPESITWTQQHGADLVVNHRHDLVREVHALGIKDVDYILGLSDLDSHWDEMCALIKPGGHIASITENRRPIDLKKLTKKRGTFAWEWMYSKSYYHTADMISQHYILDTIANLLDHDLLKSTLSQTLQPINALNLRQAHQLIEQRHMIGKVVIEGWNDLTPYCGSGNLL